jgi:hypothetical protein
VGGSTEEVYQAKLTQRDATQEAAAEVRRRAEQVAAAENRQQER